MPNPTWTVEAGWTNSITGFIVIGGSLIGGEDAIGGTFAYASFVSVPEVRELRIERGRSDDLTQFNAGRLSLVLFDATGKYNPLNAGSSLYPNVLPMRPIRVKADFTVGLTTTTYNLFYGFITSIEYNADPDNQTARIEAIDLFEWLDKSYPTIGTQTNQDTGTLIGTILSAIGWSQTSLRSLETNGKTIPSFSADGTTSALALIQNLLEVDRGVFYIAGNGTATYKSHATLAKVETATATITQTAAAAMRPSVQAQLIVNGQTVTKTGSTAQTVTDQTSRQTYGQRDGSAITSAYLANDSQADSLARLIVAERKDPQSPARPVQLVSTMTSDLWPTALARELSEYVTLTDSVYGTAVSGHVDQVTHEWIEHGGTSLRTTLLVTKKNVNEITIGSSTIDGAHLVGY